MFTHRSLQAARKALAAWFAWAARSRLPAFVKLGRTVREHLDGILAFIDSGLTSFSCGRVR